MIFGGHWRCFEVFGGILEVLGCFLEVFGGILSFLKNFIFGTINPRSVQSKISIKNLLILSEVDENR